jgi:putative component of toxin-antitoxin plasmid stabilization module
MHYAYCPLRKLLLCGGDKSKPDADIDKAIQHLADFKRKTK